jgi:hypothetical protein
MNQDSPLLQKGLLTLMAEVLRRWEPMHPALNALKFKPPVYSETRREPYLRRYSDKLARNHRAQTGHSIGSGSNDISGIEE